MTKIESNPTVSVVIPTYNRAHLTGTTLQSVLSQTYQDFELIIVDDGSIDNTEEVVKAFTDERLRYIRMEKNSGTAGVPRNKGIEASRGEFIAFLDSDDEWLPEKLEKQINKFKSVPPEVGLIHSGFYIIREAEKRIIESTPTDRGDVFQSAVKGSLAVAVGTTLVRKECFQKAGVFDTELLGSEDWEMLIRLARYYQFDFVPEILVKYYVYGAQKSHNLERQIQGYDRITRKYRNYLPKKINSRRWQYLGTLCCYPGHFKQARRYFAEAIRENPGDIYAYLRFLLCTLAPRLYQARLKRLYANGIVFWDRL